MIQKTSISLFLTVILCFSGWVYSQDADSTAEQSPDSSFVANTAGADSIDVIKEEFNSPLNTPKVIIAPEDLPLELSAIWESPKNGDTIYVEISHNSSSPQSILCEVNNLREQENPKLKVLSEQLTFDKRTIRLDSGQVYALRIIVSGVAAPGKYVGAMKFSIDGIKGSYLSYPITVNFPGEPRIELLTVEPNDLQIVLNPWLSWMLPAYMRKGRMTVPIQNLADEDAIIESYHIEMFGVKSGRHLDTDNFELVGDSLNIIPANEKRALEFKLLKDDVIPDEYTGNIYVKFAGSNQPQAKDTKMLVRSGPWWAVLVLILGIVVGRMIQSSNKGRIAIFEELVPEYNKLNSEVDGIKHTEGKTALRKQLKRYYQALNNADEGDEELLRTKAEALDAQIDMILAIEDQKYQLDTAPGSKDSGLEKYIIECDDLILEIANKDVFTEKDLEGLVVEVQNLNTNIKVAVASMQGPEMDGDLQSRGLPDIKEIETKKVDNALDRIRKTPGSSKNAVRLRKFMSLLSGVNINNPNVWYWVIRPLSVLLLLFILVYTGLQALYIEPRTAFGLEGLGDYFGLFTWGLSSDVATRSLATFGTGGLGAPTKG